MARIKIFISYKDKHKIIKSDVIQPIQTGRAIAKDIFEEIWGDDTGDNISSQNPKYCELSAQYWVWKHYEEIGNPEYVGFMHYRRHFIFDTDFNIDNKEPWLSGMPIYKIPTFNEECIRNLETDKINNLISENADCYAIASYDIRKFHNYNLYMKEHYISTITGAKRINWTTFYEVICDLYPSYKQLLDRFAYGHTLNCCNMFIMKKDLFFEYSEFCFNVLKEIDKRVDSSKYNPQELRFLGFLGEYLLTIYIMKLLNEGKKIKFLNAYLITDIDDILGINKQSLKTGLQKLFSITNDDKHKILTIFGLKIKLKMQQKKYTQKQIFEQLKKQEKDIHLLMNKITELQEELIKKGKYCE